MDGEHLKKYVSQKSVSVINHTAQISNALLNAYTTLSIYKLPYAIDTVSLA